MAKHTSPPLVDIEEPLSKWRVFKRAFANHEKKQSKPPTLQEIKMEMESGDGYSLSKWRVFKRAFANHEKKQSKPPILQEIKMEMESGDGYRDIFPEMFKLLNILLVLQVGTDSVKCSFSLMKLELINVDLMKF